MSTIDPFSMETPQGKSTWTKQNILSLVHFFFLDQIPNIKICHMVASEHPEVAEGRRRLIAMEVPDPEEESEDGSIDDDGDASDEEDDSGPVEAGMRKYLTGVWKKMWKGCSRL